MNALIGLLFVIITIWIAYITLFRLTWGKYCKEIFIGSTPDNHSIINEEWLFNKAILYKKMWRNSQLKDSENNRIVFIDTIIDDVSNQSMFGPSKRKKQLFGLIKKDDTLDKLIVTTLSSVATYWGCLDKFPNQNIILSEKEFSEKESYFFFRKNIAEEYVLMMLMDEDSDLSSKL